MYRTTLTALTVALIVVAGAMLGLLPVAAQQDDPSASRSFSASTVDPGGEVVVTISASNYGGAGGVTETLPDGFEYDSSSLDMSQVREFDDSNDVRFLLRTEQSFTYTVTASDTPDDYDFSGKLRDADRNDFDVGGDSTVTVTAAATPTPSPTPTPTPEPGQPSASRSFSASTVDPGGEVVVTISASNYGGAGGVTETLPDGFEYESSSLDMSQVRELDGSNDVRFLLRTEQSFTYTVTASDTPDDYDFSGKLRDADLTDFDVGGDSTVTVEAVSPSASRSFSASTVDPGGEVVVTISASNYGGAGAVTEALPDGFEYESSSLDMSQVRELDGSNDVRFLLRTEQSFTYTVTASDTPDDYDFSGKLRDADRNDFDVSGDSSVTVKAPATTATTTPTPTDDMKPDVSWNVPQALVLNVRIRPISPITEDDIASYAIEKGQLPRVLRLDETTGVITGRPGRETSAATTVTIKVCDTSGKCALVDLRFPRVVDPTIVESTPTPTLPRVPEPDLTGVTVGGAAPSTTLQIALAAAGGTLLLGGAGIMAARRRARVKR